MSPLNQPPPRPRVRTPGKHIVLFAGAALAVVGAGVGFLGQAPHAGAPAPPAERIVSSKTIAVPLETFLVDLQPDRSGRVAYLKLAAIVAAPAADGARVAARVEEERAAIRERLAFLLRGLSPEDFSGADAMARVKTEMLRRVNLVIAPERAAEIVITDLVIQ